MLSHFIDEFLQRLSTFGTLAYAILFGVIFVETGLVIFPFLPGDSLLFAIGAFASRAGSTWPNVLIIYPLLICAALIGDNCNYFLGQKFGRKLFENKASKSSKLSKFLNPNNLTKTEAFFAKHGGKAVIMARFVPIVRTFAPFVAGMGAMKYSQFLLFSVIGAVLWVGICVTAGYQLGSIPFFQKNFELVLVAIVFVSLAPVAFEIWQHKKTEQNKENSR
jgi:membrane-associated protein